MTVLYPIPDWAPGGTRCTDPDCSPSQLGVGKRFKGGRHASVLEVVAPPLEGEGHRQEDEEGRRQ